MSKKTIIFTSITFIIVVLLIISTFIWDYKELVLIKDLSLAGTLSFSLIKTLNINATFNKYKTTIKELMYLSFSLSLNHCFDSFFFLYHFYP